MLCLFNYLLAEEVIRSLKKQQKFWYSTYANQITIYAIDEKGNIVYDEIDGERFLRIIAERAGYDNPVSFYANIDMSSGEAEEKEYGVNASDYEAILVTMDKSLPIDALTRIWHTLKPKFNSDDMVDGASADYSVLAVKPSLNGMKYLLKKLTKTKQ